MGALQNLIFCVEFYVVDIFLGFFTLIFGYEIVALLCFNGLIWFY
jgi:hypothetical protein